MKKILITGGNGQLGNEFKWLSEKNDSFEFVFTDANDLDITSLDSLMTYFSVNKFDFCVNCAAYTAVDKAEAEVELSHQINEFGAENLAKACSEFGVVLFHISTDFVFEGNNFKPYTEADLTHPISVYGESKLGGENRIAEVLDQYFIIRTSWLYSSYGNNFVKTMLRLGEERDRLNIISDQIGSPTYARDLAEYVLHMIGAHLGNDFGVYHFSNQGVASWYDFAKQIFDIKNIDVKVSPIPTTDYPTPAKRPHYSVMDKSKIEKTFGKEILYWRESLVKCLELL
ncbi:dTDP-4-dehydrorhamnose reductase [Sediminitomix flava]|uniref:dTDP-4-dehydrorhamnose reductase n=1 Tax=Sediminitomix flava TaxID=379075 RepID=A0A315Z6Y9_SEDFL|nr:dTDP-4-dehydrorhamnose reductase [Sediminitomix flava]PWJ39404.1 dTDP-4-dehydrorhamnose reductase [Sediminitomix flava]